MMSVRQLNSLVRWDSGIDRRPRLCEIQCMFLSEGNFRVAVCGRVSGLDKKQAHCEIRCHQPLVICVRSENDIVAGRTAQAISAGNSSVTNRYRVCASAMTRTCVTKLFIGPPSSSCLKKIINIHTSKIDRASWLIFIKSCVNAGKKSCSVVHDDATVSKYIQTCTPMGRAQAKMTQLEEEQPNANKVVPPTKRGQTRLVWSLFDLNMPTLQAEV